MVPLERLPDRPANIFVVGDLVIDHAIFVVGKTRPFHTVDEEKVYDVKKRINIAGGAANCARILGAINQGNTYLWGVTGRSLWGAFSDVLEASEVADVTASKVLLTGYHDDTVRMNTITRVIRVDPPFHHVHQARFDDVGSVGPSHLASQSLLHQLTRAHQQDRLNAIIISDLDMNALDRTLINEISLFARANNIALFIDPKRNFAKYASVQATAILPNLYEWCELIGERDNEPVWRAALRTREGLERIAHRSLQHFDGFQYHIIKCDKDGVVVIGPSQETRYQFAVIHLPPHETEPNHAVVHQLGSGDVLTAIAALEFVANDAAVHPTERMIRAVRVASWVVAAFRQMSWGQMPSRQDVLMLRTPIPATLDEVEVSGAVRYVPPTDVVDLRSVRTDVPKLLSVDEKYKSELQRLLQNLQSGWTPGTRRSVIVTARGGSGKSEICAALPELLRPSDVGVLLADDRLLKVRAIDQLVNQIEREKNSRGASALLVVIDEAFARSGRLLQKKSGVLLLDALHEKSVRLLMIDADFHSARKHLSESQFLTRCDIFELPALSDRPHDIAYVFLAGCSAAAAHLGYPQFACERRTLASVVEFALRGTPTDQSPRTIFVLGREAFQAAASKADDRSVVVRPEHLNLKLSALVGLANSGIVQVRY